MSVHFKNMAIPVNGEQPVELAFPENVDFAGAVLAGFEVNFQDKEHFFHKLDVKVTPTLPGTAPYSKILLSGTALIQDKDPEHLSTGSATAMVYGYTLNDPTIRVGYAYWNNSSTTTSTVVQYLHQPISEATVYIQSIYLETKDTDFEVSSLRVDAGNSTIELGPLEEDSMGYQMQRVYFTPSIKLEKRDGKPVDVKSATLQLIVVASVVGA